MRELLPRAEKIGALLRTRGQTVCVAESSTGGLISAALLGVAGASAYFMGGAVIYTITAREKILGIGEADLAGGRAATEIYALMMARRLRDRLETTWCIAETGASGPTGNRYGDPPGHTCLAVVGTHDCATTLRTGIRGRVDNMYAFADAALKLFEECLEKDQP
jgi:nicotinamide-nucleotide amidase